MLVLCLTIDLGKHRPTVRIFFFFIVASVRTTKCFSLNAKCDDLFLRVGFSFTPFWQLSFTLLLVKVTFTPTEFSNQHLITRSRINLLWAQFADYGMWELRFYKLSIISSAPLILVATFSITGQTAVKLVLPVTLGLKLEDLFLFWSHTSSFGITYLLWILQIGLITGILFTCLQNSVVTQVKQSAQFLLLGSMPFPLWLQFPPEELSLWLS